MFLLPQQAKRPFRSSVGFLMVRSGLSSSLLLFGCAFCTLGRTLVPALERRHKVRTEFGCAIETRQSEMASESQNSTTTARDDYVAAQLYLKFPVVALPFHARCGKHH